MKPEELFGQWEETIIWSCLQGVMGEIYTDEQGEAAMAILGDFAFFAGKPNEELLRFKPSSCKQNFIIMVPQNEEWAALIEKCYGEKVTKVSRYAIKKEKDRTAYKQKHEADFIIYESARRYFDSQGIKKLPTNAAIRAEIQRLIAEKNTAYNTYYADKERFKELQTIQQNLAYMRGEPQPERNKKHEQSL